MDAGLQGGGGGGPAKNPQKNALGPGSVMASKIIAPSPNKKVKGSDGSSTIVPNIVRAAPAKASMISGNSFNSERKKLENAKENSQAYESMTRTGQDQGKKYSSLACHSLLSISSSLQKRGAATIRAPPHIHLMESWLFKTPDEFHQDP